MSMRGSRQALPVVPAPRLSRTPSDSALQRQLSSQPWSRVDRSALRAGICAMSWVARGPRARGLRDPGDVFSAPSISAEHAGASPSVDSPLASRPSSRPHLVFRSEARDAYAMFRSQHSMRRKDLVPDRSVCERPCRGRPGPLPGR